MMSAFALLFSWKANRVSIKERIRKRYSRSPFKNNPPLMLLSDKPYITITVWKKNTKYSFILILFDLIKFIKKYSRLIAITNNKEYLIGVNIWIKSVLIKSPFKLNSVINAPNPWLRKRGLEFKFLFCISELFLQDFGCLPSKIKPLSIDYA